MRSNTNQDPKEIYLEKVSHITNTSPYSIYKIGFLQEEALYLHWHPDFELYYLEEGDLDFCIEDIHIPLKAGEAVFIPPNLLHRADCANLRGGLFRALVFSPDFISASMSMEQFRKMVQPVLYNNKKFILHLKQDEEWQKQVLADLVRIFAADEKEQQEGAAGTEELLTAGLSLVIWQGLYDHCFSQVDESGGSVKLEQQLKEPVRFIREHFSEDITLEALARLAHMSEGQFCRSFRQLTGSTPFTYLKKLRIMHSCTYLAGTDKKISEICTLCGFSNISYFNREFLKIMRTTPSGYRKRESKN